MVGSFFETRVYLHFLTFSFVLGLIEKSLCWIVGWARQIFQIFDIIIHVKTFLRYIFVHARKLLRWFFVVGERLIFRNIPGDVVMILVWENGLRINWFTHMWWAVGIWNKFMIIIKSKYSDSFSPFSLLLQRWKRYFLAFDYFTDDSVLVFFQFRQWVKKRMVYCLFHCYPLLWVYFQHHVYQTYQLPWSIWDQTCNANAFWSLKIKYHMGSFFSELFQLFGSWSSHYIKYCIDLIGFTFPWK